MPIRLKLSLAARAVPEISGLKDAVYRAFTAKGIRHVGACSFSDLPPLLEVRAASRLPVNPQSVIVCATPYFCGDYPQRNLARYAICDDYHQTGGALLGEICAGLAKSFPGHDFRPFIDISPIPEVKAAHLAGLGVIGLHGQLILPDYGAYTFIGCVVTDLAIEPSQPSPGTCLECEACLQACPTKALGRQGLNRELCRSYITQKTGELTVREQEQIKAGKMVWGCDICLDACPLCKNAAHTPLERMRRSPLPILNRENLDVALKRKAYGYRGRKVLERNLALLGL